MCVIDSDGHGSKPRSLLSLYIIVDIEPTLLEQNQSLPNWFLIDQILHKSQWAISHNANCISFTNLIEKKFYMKEFVLGQKFDEGQKYFQWAVWIKCSLRSKSGRISIYIAFTNGSRPFIPLYIFFHIQAYYFPDSSMADVANGCRNPDDSGSLWCFTVNPQIRRQNCSVPKCSGQSCVGMAGIRTGRPGKHGKWMWMSEWIPLTPRWFRLSLVFHCESSDQEAEL